MIDLKTKLSFKEQARLIQKAIQTDTPLKDYLKAKGLGYDDLRYEAYANDLGFDTPYTRIEDLVQKKLGVPAVSFFSGAGGLDIGFEYAGFDNLAAVEYNGVFAQTLRHNFPGKVVIGPPDHSGDMKERESVAKMLIDKADITAPFEGVFHGGPPCQPFSIASAQRFTKDGDNYKRRGFEDDEKGDLLFDYVWMIEKFRPRVFVIENVPGFAELDGGEGLSKAITRLTRKGYKVAKPRVLNAADFGVPQNRHRVLVVGVRDAEEFSYPIPNATPTACFGVFARSLEGQRNHDTREHGAESIERYMRLGYGQRDHLGRVDRLNPFLPSKTVIAGGTKGGGRSHLHPYIPRTISVRECARVQTFPDSYVFTGPAARQFTQVGNAVPPMLAFKLASRIADLFFR